MNELTTQTRGRPLSVFSDKTSFDEGYRIARALSTSRLVPVAYQGEENIPNAMIAMDMANRVGVSAMVVMQNLHIIEGRPSWSSQFIISALNSCGLFSPIRYRLEKLGEREVSFDTWEGPKGNRTKVVKKKKINETTSVAYAIEKDGGEILEGPEVSIAMAVAEGWYTKAGSKWVTMPELMIRYRAAAFFGRLYAPDVMNGMSTVDEVADTVEMRDVTPQADPAPTTPPDEAKPAGRPRGVHAAMAAGKAGAKDKPKKAAPVIEADAEDTADEADESSVDETQTSDGDAGADDVFGGPDEDDEYTPA